jgi:threonine/homoserine efflux transporter RhtA
MLGAALAAGVFPRSGAAYWTERRRVEFGAIKIMLDLVSRRRSARKFCAERQPLGRILTESNVEFSSQPRAFLRLASDEFINRS